MSTYFDPDSQPTPPTRSASFKQIIAMFLFGSMGSLFVVNAIKSQAGNSLRTGTILIVFALVFFAGLISKNSVVELISSGILLVGAGGLVALTINTREILWGVGAIFFVLCIAVIQLKNRFVDKPDLPTNGLRNPSS